MVAGIYLAVTSWVSLTAGSRQNIKKGNPSEVVWRGRRVGGQRSGVFVREHWSLRQGEVGKLHGTVQCRDVLTVKMETDVEWPSFPCCGCEDACALAPLLGDMRACVPVCV